MTSELKPLADMHPCPPSSGGGKRHRSRVYADGRQHYCERCGEKIDATTFSNIPETYVTTHDAGDYNKTRAAPDEPELERYEPDYCVDFRSITTAYMNSNAGGRYVLHSQAAEIIAAKDAEIDKLNVYNSSYHNQILELRELLQAAEAKLAQYEAQEPVAYIKPCDLKWLSHDNYGAISITTTKSTTHTEPLYASPAPAADLKAENERLREALKFYADVHKYPSPLTGGMGDLWSDCGRIARAALNLSEPQT